MFSDLRSVQVQVPKPSVFHKERPLGAVVSGLGEGSHQIHCRIVRLEGGFSNTSTAKHATHTSPKMAGFFSCLSDGRAEASSAPSLAPGVADPRSPAQAVPPEHALSIDHLLSYK